MDMDYSYRIWYSRDSWYDGLIEGWYWQRLNKGDEPAHGPFESLEAVSQAHKQSLIDAGQELTPVT